MENLRLYEVDSNYVNFLAPHIEHIFQNRKPEQRFKRKYIGVVLKVNGFNYFAPLSSYKPKHERMKESLDFLKIKDYAVINLNNMFSVPDGVYYYVEINKETDPQYRALLLAEYRFMKSRQDKIRKNAELVYNHKVKNGMSTPLAKRCNDFLLLENLCASYL